MYCTKCSKQNLKSARFCTGCGNSMNGDARAHSDNQVSGVGTRDRVSAQDLVYPRNPPLSPHLCWGNILFGGLAQMIHGQVAKGLVITGVMMVAFLVIPAVGNWPICIASIIDAYMVGKVLRNGRSVGKWQFFP